MPFAPASSAAFQVSSSSATDADLVAAVAAELGEPCLLGMQPYTASTALAARDREWRVAFWALPAPAAAAADGGGISAGGRRRRRIALCMHGHGHVCCVTSWARFWAPLHAAGFDIIALDAPCFGRSSGPAGQVRPHAAALSC